MSITFGPTPAHPVPAPVATLTGGRFDTLLGRFTPETMPPLIVAIGLDPELLDALDRRNAATRVLAIEPMASALGAWSTRAPASDWLASGRLTVLVGPSYEGRNQAWQLVDRRATNPPMLVSPALAQKFPDETREAKAVAQQIVRGAQSNEEARQRFAGRYVVNTLANLPVIAAEADASVLTNLFPGVPGIVIGAGPSLDRTLPSLKAVSNRALLIAVDTAVRPLLAAGIRPHIIVSVDPAEKNARHLLDLPEVRGMWFVGEGSLTPSVFRQFEGRTFVFKVSSHEPWPWLAAHGADRATLRAWGSVLTTTFDLALRTGCDPIVFAGADLAYTSGLQYCRNTVYEGEWSHLPTDEERAAVFADFVKSRARLTVHDVSGRDTVTVPHFVQFRDWIATEASAARDRQIVNATGAGILQGTAIKQLPLDSLRLPVRLGSDGDLRARLHEAWAASAAGGPAARERLDQALAYGQEIPFDRWTAFGGDTTSAAQLSGTARAAAGRIGTDRHQAEYLTGLRESYNRRIHTLEDAQALSHGHYDIAARRASSQQAHVLLDFLQRSYTVNETGLRKIFRAMSAVPRDLRVLDVGCGVGRLMVPLADAGIRVDGVDISERMIHFARQHPSLVNAAFFVSNGADCGQAPDGAYGLVYSQLCFRYITSRSVRNDLLLAMARALRPGGGVVVEMRFFPELTATSIPKPHVPWSADAFAPVGDPHQADVRPTPDELHLVYADFARHFEDVRLQFVDVPKGDRKRLPPHLVISGSIGTALGDRIHARFLPPVKGQAPA